MKKVFVFTVIGLALCATLVLTTERRQASRIEPVSGYGQIPLYFVANHGQAEPEALFYAETPAYTLWLTRQGLRFDRTAMAFPGARPDVKISALEPADYTVSYFDGPEESDWRTGIPASKAILYEDLFEGIDLKIYGQGKAVEYDWLVRAGADPNLIRFSYPKDARTRLDGEGDLVVETSAGEIEHKKPMALQVVDGRRVEIAAAFRRTDDGGYGFALGPYDRRCDLVIDPLVLVYSTYLGGGSLDMPWIMDNDSSGASYIVGMTSSGNFPPEKSRTARQDAFVTKISPDGQSLIYTAFFPVANGFAADVAVDGAGAAYVVGQTDNNRFPVKNAYQSSYGGGMTDGFFLKLAPNGKSLVFSSYFGDKGFNGVITVGVDSRSAVYLGVQESLGLVFAPGNGLNRSSLSILKNGLNGRGGSSIVKFDPDGKKLVYKYIIHGEGTDSINDLTVDGSGAVYAVGGTSSRTFPVKNAFQKRYGGGWADCYIVKLAPSGGDVEYASYLGGGSYDYFPFVAVDAGGCAYVTGSTDGNFHVKNAFQKTRAGSMDAFLAKIAANGKSLIYSTYLGGEGVDFPYDLAVDGTGKAYLAGFTQSVVFPVKNAYQSVKKGNADGFLTVFKSDGSGLDLSTRFGGAYHDEFVGLAIDGQGGICLTGCTNSVDLPLLNPYQGAYAGGYYDGFVVKFKK